MGKKITRGRPWTKEELRMLKTLAREKTKTTVIARKLKRSVAAVYLRASKLAVMLGGGRGRKGACQRPASHHHRGYLGGWEWSLSKVA
jgi:hypothetical protein